ncbi:hypothetical protein [Leuconostoc suionicum]|uniref:hypothetical protein n=1 Tax=Leuconostoc suionicum TaxID=1511761 RepID=UPI0032DE806B
MAKTTLWYSNDTKNSFTTYNTKLTNQIKNGFSLPSSEYPGFKMKQLVNNEKLQLDTINTNYSLYECSVDNASGNFIKFSLIVFDINGKVGFVLEKASGALKLLRLLFSYGPSDKLVIEQENYPSNTDVEKIFFLTIDKIYRKKGKISLTNNGKPINFDLNRLDSIKGRTSGSLNSVSTRGNDVINMLSTMSFLLETSMLSDITVALSFNRNTSITISIHTNNSQTQSTQISADVFERKYSGYLRSKKNGFSNSDLDFQKLRASLLLMIHLEILPLIVKALPASKYAKMKPLLNKKIVSDLQAQLAKL